MSGKTIVVVDDEPLIVEMITMFFELNGYTVHGVNTGREGLVLVDVEKPDVLLLDLMMPDIEGFEVAAQLRAKPEFAHLPIVIITARIDPESRKRAIKAGATVYLTKPLKMPEVLAEVERVLRAPPEQPSPPAKS
jgi:DNA-binding response OmpR family regulator